MTRFVVGDDRSQSTLFPERLDDYLGEDNPVRAIDVLVDELDLAKLGFDGVEPQATGRPAYHPATFEDLRLRLPQPRAVEPSAGTGVPTQHRVGLADGQADAGSTRMVWPRANRSLSTASLADRIFQEFKFAPKAARSSRSDG